MKIAFAELNAFIRVKYRLRAKAIQTHTVIPMDIYFINERPEKVSVAVSLKSINYFKSY